jgi:hypothetical protein
MLGRDHHIGAAEQRIGPRGENFERAGSFVLEVEEDLGTFAATNPGFLHPFRGVRPVDVL